ncbi:TPA: hypothetical protein MB812_004067 [Klebsiella pneumoniae]|jgi:hypothetical protein|uniref:hypothetical protein n=1 Tax=Klebsiella pneumoniae TaxID=573 RepID=UPI000B8C40F0|nr:hypothetical protein [Klebsiella pneumoniae]AXS22641.1 hypothetical protein D0887_29695 [Klebsiella pneumoniae]OXS86663.1 hypothetical protein B6R99_29590 [Klebsiella pneumoniae]RBQ54736.1 hypothetical protein C2128_10450 [Klebsiella pneumoniae]UZJ06463.1 hypothetical protein JMX68_00440 [Klebsiella pneumoniae]UZJ17633.1 hypothetical protein JMX78_28125 [Klebsiella pneumoniae]
MQHENIVLIEEVYKDFTDKIANLNDFSHTVKKNTENIALDIEKKDKELNAIRPQMNMIN